MNVKKKVLCFHHSQVKVMKSNLGTLLSFSQIENMFDAMKNSLSKRIAETNRMDESLRTFSLDKVSHVYSSSTY